MERLGISARLGMLIAIMGLAILALALESATSEREELENSRKQMLLSLVESAEAIGAHYAAQAEAGVMTQETARTRAAEAIRAIRYGNNEYLFVYERTGKNVVLGPRPDLEGQNLSHLRDANDTAFVTDLIDAGFSGGGFIAYDWQREEDQPPVPKLSYAGHIPAFDWMVGTGVYIDDIDAEFAAAVLREAILVGFLLLLALLAGWLIARSIARPLHRITGAVEGLAGGELDVSLREARHNTELDRLSRAVATLRENERQRRELQAERKEADKRRQAERRETILQMADTLEQSVLGIVGDLTEAGSRLTHAAGSVGTAADETRDRAGTVAGAAAEASANAQNVAGATQELSSSIDEITRQVTRSSEIARDAEHRASDASTSMAALRDSADSIGDVIKLISAIAEQTNLLALNATIEAARAGEAGRGFAVVASEVKTLAQQTAQATEDIAGRIGTMQTETGNTAEAITRIGETIQQITEIANAVASAVEQQNSVALEIARNVEETASGAAQVSTHIEAVAAQAGQSSTEAATITTLAGELSSRTEALRGSLDTYLHQLRA